MKSITVEYRHNFPLDPLDVVRVFDHSGIKRPTGELPRIARMFAAPCLLLSAWVDGKLLGLARSLTDHAYCCYLSDLAVNKQYQGPTPCPTIPRSVLNSPATHTSYGANIE